MIHSLNAAATVNGDLREIPAMTVGMMDLIHSRCHGDPQGHTRSCVCKQHGRHMSADGNKQDGVSNQSTNTARDFENIEHCDYTQATHGDTLNKFSRIQLSPKNIVEGHLPDKSKMVILLDSGSYHNMISQKFIESSPYLSSLKQNDIKETSFLVAGGGKMMINKTIDFTVSIQNQNFVLRAFVMSDCGTISLLLGSKSLAEMQGNLNFTNNTLTVRQKKIYIKPTKDYVLKPGVQTSVDLFTQLPKTLVSSSLIINFNKFISKFTVPSAFVKFRRGKCGIIMVNTGNRPVKILQSKPVGHIDIVASFSPVMPASISTWNNKSSSQPLKSETKSEGHGSHTCTTQLQSEKIDRQQLRQEKMELYQHLDPDDPKLTLTDREILCNELDMDPKETVLGPDEIEEFKAFLLTKKQVFSLHGEIGDTGYEVTLDLKDPSPCFIRPFSVSEEDKIKIDKHVEKLVCLGILRPGMASCTFPLMLIAKKGQTTPRLVSDLRKLNTKLHKISYPFPLVQDTLQTLGASGSTVFSVLDIKEAFHSLRLHPESQRFVGVSTYPGGRPFVYQRLAMGLSVSMQKFQQYMDSILAELPGSSRYVLSHADDVIIFSPNKATHKQHLENVLNLFIKHGLKISPKKAQFFRHTLVYMGHIITVKNGQPHVTVLKSRAEAIQRMKQPRNVRETRGFIGAVNYLSMFLPGLSKLLKPFYDLTKKKAKFDWTVKHQENFDKIKHLIQHAPVLATCRAHGQFILETDTSRVSCGGALYQIQDGEKRLIAYFSKALPPAAVNYSVSELELCGLYLAITSFSNLLKGNHFQAIVDHSSLVQILKSKTDPPTMRLKRLIEKLSPYSFEIGYKSANKLVLVDFLSRGINPENPDEILKKIKVDSDYNIDQVLAKNIEKCVNSPISLTVTQSDNLSSNDLYTGQNDIALPTVADKASAGQTVQPRYMSRSVSRNQRIKLPSLFDREAPKTKKKQTNIPKSAITPTLQPRIEETILETTPEREPPEAIPEVEGEQPQFDMLDPRQVPETHMQSAHNNDIQVEKVSLSKLKDTQKQTSQQLLDHELAKQRLETQKITNQEEIYGEAPAYLYKPDKPIFDSLSTDDIVLKHYPKQSDVDRILQSVAHRCITDYSLPLKHADLKVHQQKDPFFKQIYNYLSCGLLPPDKKRAKSVIRRSENFLLANGVLFKIDYTDNGSSFKLALCVPDALVPMIIEKHHNTLYSSHQGVQRTYLQIRRSFYCHKLFDKLRAYIASCIRCQTRKDESPQAKERSMVPRIFDKYIPFSEVHIDVKYLYRSNDAYNYLLVCVCPLTRYVVGIPIRKQDTISISEAILQRIVFVFGRPSRIVADQHPSNSSKILMHIYKTLGIEPVFISPANHQSLVVERFVGSISRLLLSHLENTGKNWTAYVPACVYSYNSFPIPSLGGYSPYELVYGRKAPEMLNLHLMPIPNIPISYQQYLTNLQDKFDKMGKIVLDLQKEKQLKQVQEHEQKVAESGKFVQDQLVYFLCPSAGDLQTGTLKFVSRYVGPLVIAQLLDPNHVILKDLSGKILFGNHSTKRIKAAFIRTPLGIASTFAQFQKGFNLKNENPETKLSDLEFVDEKGQILNKFSNEHSMFLTEGDTNTENEEREFVMSIQKFAANNQGMAVHKEMSQKQITQMAKHISKLPPEGTTLTVTKSRFKEGHLELLMTGQNGYFIWIRLYLHPYMWDKASTIMDLVMKANRKVRPTGSPWKVL